MRLFSFVFCFFGAVVCFQTCAFNDEPQKKNFQDEYKLYYVPDLNAYFYIDDIPDGIKWHLKQGIYWESTIGKLIKKYVKESTVAVDVGAHIGIHTITMSRKVGPKGRVFAFEPQHKMYGELIENLKINGCSNVSSYRVALGEVNKFVQLNKRDPVNEGGTAIGQGGDLAEMVTLDSLNLVDVSLIKIDVERYEYFVLQGARKTILKNKPVIIFELLAGYEYQNCPHEIKQQFDETLDFVKSLGYKVELIFGSDYIALPLR